MICLDTIDAEAEIRVLRCSHIFHQRCLDEWFVRWNQYCPLCHRPILMAEDSEPDITPAVLPMAMVV